MLRKDFASVTRNSATPTQNSIYCSISPFGEDGPLRDAPGSELVVQAMAEYTASLGRIGDPPVRVGADVASLNTGIFATQAILAALFHRIRTGEGQRVAVSEFGSLLHMRGIMWHSMSDPDDWYGFHLDHYTKPPDYGYQTKNGALYFILRRGSSEDWDRLVMELGMEEALADPRFDDYGRAATSIGRYATEVKPIWEKAFAQSNARGDDRSGEEYRRRRGADDGLPVPARSSAGRGAGSHHEDRSSHRRTVQNGAPGRALFRNPGLDSNAASNARTAY